MSKYNQFLIDIHDRLKAAMSAAYVENRFSEPEMTFRALRNTEDFVLTHISGNDRPVPWKP